MLKTFGSTYIFLLEGILPSYLEISIVIPVHKAGKRGDPTILRPKSLSPFMTKNIEKFVAQNYERSIGQ